MDIGFNILAKDKGASAAFGKVAKSIDSTTAAMAKVEKATEAVASASTRLQKAQGLEADAAGKVRVAEAKLEEIRKSGKAKASRIAAAEENLAAAHWRAASATDATRTASKRYTDSQSAAEKAAKELGEAQEAAGKKSRRQSTDLDRVAKSADSTEKKFGFLSARTHGLTAGMVAGFGKVAVAMGAVATVAVFKSFITEAQESRKVGRLTESIIKSTGGAAKVSASQVGALATAISNKTGVDDEAIQSGSNLLLTFKNVRNEVGKGANIFDRATQAAVDLSAAGFGDVNSASKMLGKALNDPLKGLTALGKAGVTFTADQKKQIETLVETGNVLGAQKIILKEVESQVGGAAAASADPMEKLGVIIGNVKETIGTAFLPAVDKAATWLGNVLPGAVATGGKFFSEKLLPPLKAVTGFVTDKVVPGFVGLWNLLVKHDFSKEFRKAFHVEEDSGIVSFLLKINEGVTDAAANAKKWAASIIDGFTAGFKTGNWAPLGKALGDGVVAGLKGIGTAGGKILDAIGNLLDSVDWGKLGTKIGNGIRSMIHAVDWKAVGDSVGNAVVDLFQKTSGLAEKVGTSFRTLMKSVDWNKVGRDSTDAIGQFVAGVDWGKVAKTLGISALKSLKFSKNIYDTVVGSASDLIIGMATEIGKAIGKWFGNAGSWLKGKGKELIDGLTSGASEQTSGIGAWFQTHAITPVVDKFKGAGKWLVSHGRELITGLKDGVWSFAQGLDDWMMRAPVAKLMAPWYGAIKWLVGPGKNVITGLKNGIVSVAKSIGSWVSGSVIKPTVGAFSKAGTWLVQHGRNLVAGFKNGVSSIARSINSWLTQSVVTPVVSRFTKAGTWLNQHGRNLVAGFKNGISAIAGTIGRWAYDHVIVPVVRPFGKAIGWLNRAGRDLIGGLTSGIAGRMKGIGTWVKANVVDPVIKNVKKFFGIKSPSTVFAGIGSHLVSGLMKGLSTTSGTQIAKKIFGDMPSALRSIVGKGLISVSNLPSKALNALGSAIGVGAPLGGPSGNASNEGIVRTLAAQYGWGSGEQWNSLRALIMGESGFRNTAQNPTSSAYGLFQFLDSTWGSVGASKTSDPWAQTIAGLKYIAGSYGSPANAYAKWSSRSPHWYEKGTPWVPNDQLAFLHEGEAVVPRKVNEARMAASGGGAQTVVLEFRSDGSPHMDWLINEFRRYVRVTSGGNVQKALGRG